MSCPGQLKRRPFRIGISRKGTYLMNDQRFGEHFVRKGVKEVNSVGEVLSNSRMAQT